MDACQREMMGAKMGLRAQDAERRRRARKGKDGMGSCGVRKRRLLACLGSFRWRLMTQGKQCWQWTVNLTPLWFHGAWPSRKDIPRRGAEARRRVGRFLLASASQRLCARMDWSWICSRLEFWESQVGGVRMAMAGRGVR